MSEEVNKPPVVCKSCNKPKKQASGSLTQWVFEEGYCICGRIAIALESDAQEQAEKSDVQFCSTCGKRSNSGRAGSLTQWIFRQETCLCGNQSISSRVNRAGSGELDLSGSRHQRAAIASDAPLLNEPDAEEELISLSEMDFPAARYKPLGNLGRGASGAVYKCYDRQLKRLVAIKILHVLNPEESLHFQNEARASAQLNCPGIIRTLDFGITAGGHPYMVMDFVRGMTLTNYLKEVGVMSLEDTRYLASRIAIALSYAHRHDIFHRDIKPGNIMVVPTIDGLLKDVTLIDLGMAMYRKAEDKNSRPTLAGTPLYMSSDQAEGKNYDARSEVYSVGCVLYEMLVGKPPFEADSLLELLNLHANEKPPAISSRRNDIPPDSALEAVINKCLAKSPDDRFQSMEELSDAIDEVEPMESPSNDGRVEVERLQENNNSAARSSKFSKMHVFAILVAVCFAAAVAVQLMTRPKASPNLSRNFKRDGSFHKASFESVDKMVDFVENLHDQKYVPEPALFTLEDGSIFLKNSYACDSFIQTLKLAPDQLKQLLVSDGPVTGKGLSILCEGNSLRMLHLQILPNLKQADVVATLKKNPQLGKVNLTSLELAPSIVASFANLRDLEWLYFKYMNLAGADFAPLAKLPNLRSLTVRYCKVGNHEVEQISTIKSLVFVDITGAHIDDQTLLKLSQLPNLKAAYVASCKSVTLKGIKAFTEAAPHCKVEYSIPYATPQTIEYFYDDSDLLKAVRAGRDSIDASSWSITNEGMGYLVGKPIKYLSLSDTKLTDKAFTKISKIQTLDSLMISAMERVTDGALLEIAKLKNLKRISMNRSPFSDEATAKLCESLPLLAEFQANSMRAASKTCQALSRKKRLEFISLENCDLHDADIALLAKIPSVRVLIISGNSHLTKKGFLLLARCHNLSKLQISAPADDETRRVLKERLPNCQVNIITDPKLAEAKQSRP